jgi:transcriptional regulator with XRE-family HTH domain
MSDLSMSHDEKESALMHMIGQRLRWWRRKRAITQPAIAHHIGVSVQQYQKYESGKNRLSISKALMIAEGMEVPFAELFDVLGRES